MMQRVLPVSVLCLTAMVSCSDRVEAPRETTEKKTEAVGWIERADPALDSLVASDAIVEILAEGFTWAEGPVWISEQSALLFSDVPENVIHRWDATTGLQQWLSPSGNTGYASGAREGSNGLLLDPQGHLVLCQHGDRRVARLNAPLAEPSPVFETVADRYAGKQFNSPNDAAYNRHGDLYFTDPPYGLADESNSELGFQGVYRVRRGSQPELLTDELSRPNGIAFSPDQRTLYVANSDPKRAIWMAYDVGANGSISNGRVFFDATEWAADRPGLPDGLKVDLRGNVFATGPGGVLIFDPSGKHLGTIRISVPAANCAFGDDGSSLYITADMYLLRVRLRTSGFVGTP